MTQLPAYPDFTGREPCATDPSAFYPRTSESSHPQLARARTEAAKEMCSWCPIIHDCLLWGLYRERHGVWGGTTEAERAALRRRAGIRLHSPEAQWDLDHLIIRARRQRAALLETGT